MKALRVASSCPKCQTVFDSSQTASVFFDAEVTTAPNGLSPQNMLQLSLEVLQFWEFNKAQERGTRQPAPLSVPRVASKSTAE